MKSTYLSERGEDWKWRICRMGDASKDEVITLDDEDDKEMTESPVKSVIEISDETPDIELVSSIHRDPE